MSVQIIHGDMLLKLDEIEPDSIDAIVTDPPYHLVANKKDSPLRASPDAAQRARAGFMGMRWDGGDIAMRPETWAALLRVAKPGAHLLAFSSSRTFHRMWCAVEDAGWEIRDTLMWLHGEGFPKSSNQSGEWQGWGTALKPAFEPILMARKPLIGTVAENLAQHRTGALNIDASRVGYAGTEDAAAAAAAAAELRSKQTARNVEGWGMKAQDKTAAEFANGPAGLGRWPANVLHDGSDEVVGMFPAEAGAVAPVHRRGADKFRGTYGAFAGNVDEAGSTFHGDSGSAARFFWCPKASRRDRNEGLEGMPRQAVNWSSGEQSPGTFQSPNTDRFNENHHPTVKPTELMRYLCRLVTPPGGTVLDPFMGSGSTGKAAVREGFSFVGIELDERYIEIARRRIHSDAPLFAGLA